MAKEFRVAFDKISDPQKITQVNREEFKSHDVDMSQHEVKELVDDHQKQERIYKIKNTRFFDMGRRSGR